MPDTNLNGIIGSTLPEGKDLQNLSREFLSSGTRLGPYQILEPVGSGGMGEVYRAIDTRLDRIVAVKVLPAHLSRDADLRHRFEQEAKAVSVLNHPNICTLHDVGREGDTEYLVMEFLDGRTLSSRLNRGPLPVDELLRYAIQMSDALDKAHRKGIVHRDLKPGNVMLTKSGVKLVDFGLAKVVQSGVSSDSSFQTEERDLTKEGTLLGTLHYMSPEQLEGKVVDARSDIFSFGAMLYEMATGHLAFGGSSPAGIIAAILKEDPKPISVPLPPGLERLIRACLQKDPDDRRQNAHDIAAELQSIAENRSFAELPIEPMRVSKWKFLLRTFAIIAVVALGLFAAGSLFRQVTVGPVLRTNILLPPGFELDPMNQSLAISPDGQSLVFAGTDSEGTTGLWLRRMDQSEAHRISGTDDSTYPFWSPDSRYVAFFADGKLKKASVEGGIAQTICDAPDGRGGTWNDQDIIVFAPDHSGGLYQTSASGGQVTQLTKPDGKNETHRLPHFLPDGKKILFYINANVVSQYSSKAGVYSLDIDSRKINPVLLEKTEASYIEPGYLTFVRDGRLMAQRFNANTMKFTGPATAIAPSVRFYVERYTGAYSVSQNYLIFLAEDISPMSQLTWFDLDGHKLESVGKKSRFSSLLLSPDEKRVLATYTLTQSRDLWVYDLNVGSNTRLTFKKEPYFESGMAWSPDGSKIAYGDIDGKLFVMNSDSSLTARPLLHRAEQKRWWPTDWSSDGKKILLETFVSQTGNDIGVLSLEDESIHPFQATEFHETRAAFSPDGNWVGYLSNESGKVELYVVPYPGPGGKWQISTGGVTDWKWVDEGRRIFYLASDRTLHSVDINIKGSVIHLGEQKNIFGGQSIPEGFLAISKDGKRLLISLPTEQLREGGLTLVENWSKELSK